MHANLVSVILKYIRCVTICFLRHESSNPTAAIRPTTLSARALNCIDVSPSGRPFRNRFQSWRFYRCHTPPARIGAWAVLPPAWRGSPSVPHPAPDVCQLGSVLRPHTVEEVLKLLPSLGHDGASSYQSAAELAEDSSGGKRLALGRGAGKD